MIGISEQALRAFDFDLSLKRIQNDLQSDFIFAPHLNAVFRYAAPDLTERLTTKLRSGSFAPKLPITLEVPKASGFTRPGSILWPFERLAYQVLVDKVAPTADSALDRSRVFSSQILDPDPDGFMFKPAGESYQSFKEEVIDACMSGSYGYVLKADVASYFERLYQHVLVNLLMSAGCDPLVVSPLEKVLALFTQKDSHGIVQGLAPSDFLGTFYLLSLDAAHTMDGVPFLRYVDDVRVFFEKKSEAILYRTKMTSLLRKDGLSMNESKSAVVDVSTFVTEETEVDSLFGDARAEVWSSLTRTDFYSSTLAWDFYPEEDFDDVEVELEATHKLFDYDASGSIRLKIDSFCLPVFGASGDTHAVDYVLENYENQPSLAQKYATYISRFIHGDAPLVRRVESLLESDSLLYDYQLLWLVATLMSASNVKSRTVDRALQHLTRRRYNDAVRAACALLVGKFGNAGQRRLLKSHYQDESSAYVRASILYAARNFPSNERDTCYNAWSGHDEVNSLIVTAAKRIRE